MRKDGWAARGRALDVAGGADAAADESVEQCAFAGSGAADDADDQDAIEVGAELVESRRDSGPESFGTIERWPRRRSFDPAVHGRDEPIEFGQAEIGGPVVNGHFVTFDWTGAYEISRLKSLGFPREIHEGAEDYEDLRGGTRNLRGTCFLNAK